jgi:putative transcriptional regulator
MSSKAFNRIMAGLEQARAFAQGRPVKGTRVHRVKVARSEVASVRLKTGLTQPQFAKLLGASVGTVRKWETGERAPSGAAATLLRLLDAKPKIVSEILGVRSEAPKRMPRSQLVAAE